MPTTVVDSAALRTSPPEDVLYEIVNGHYREIPSLGAFESSLASILLLSMGQFALSQNLGLVVQETLFVLNKERNLRRRPDIAFVSFSRWPEHRPVPRSEAWPVVPNLAIEFVSPTNKTEEDHLKIQEYLRAGVELVWLVLPGTRQVMIFESPTGCRVLTESDELDGGTVLPGYRLPLSTLFRWKIEPSETPGE